MSTWTVRVEYRSTKPDARDRALALVGHTSATCTVTDIKQPGAGNGITVVGTAQAESPSQAIVTIEMLLALNAGVDEWLGGHALPLAGP